MHYRIREFFRDIHTGLRRMTPRERRPLECVGVFVLCLLAFGAGIDHAAILHFCH